MSDDDEAVMLLKRVLLKLANDAGGEIRIFMDDLPVLPEYGRGGLLARIDRDANTLVITALPDYVVTHLPPEQVAENDQKLARVLGIGDPLEELSQGTVAAVQGSYTVKGSFSSAGSPWPTTTAAVQYDPSTGKTTTTPATGGRVVPNSSAARMAANFGSRSIYEAFKDQLKAYQTVVEEELTEELVKALDVGAKPSITMAVPRSNGKNQAEVAKAVYDRVRKQYSTKPR